MTVKFKSPDEKPVFVASTNGRCAWIGDAWTEIHPSLHTLAIAKGCITDNLPRSSFDPQGYETHGVDGENRIKQILLQMHDAPEEGDLTANGKPDMRVLRRKVGFGVVREDVFRLWDELVGVTP